MQNKNLCNLWMNSDFPHHERGHHQPDADPKTPTIRTPGLRGRHLPQGKGCPGQDDDSQAEGHRAEVLKGAVFPVLKDQRIPLHPARHDPGDGQQQQ